MFEAAGGAAALQPSAITATISTPAARTNRMARWCAARQALRNAL
jgi:hypothetical protein